MKKALTFLILFALLCGMLPAALAAGDEAVAAAEELFALGLFSGVGANEDGTPNFDLDREPTRNEAVTMLVRLLRKEEEAKAGQWETPFTDVAGWAKPYVGYAYANGLTKGTGEHTFGGSELVTATQYLTFVLRALGYESGTDFQWNRAWEMSDAIGLTDGRYNADSGRFLRGDVAIVSRNALKAPLKNGTGVLAEKLISENVFTAAQYLATTGSGKTADTDWKAWYEVTDDGKLYIKTNIDNSGLSDYCLLVRIIFDDDSYGIDTQGRNGQEVFYNCTSFISYYEIGRTVTKTDFVVFRSKDIRDDLVALFDSSDGFEKAINKYSGYLLYKSTLETCVKITQSPKEVLFKEFTLTYDKDKGTETYHAYVDDIQDCGEYGLVYVSKSGNQRHVGTYLIAGEEKLYYSREMHHFADAGETGTFYITYCVNRIEKDGTVICEKSISNGLEYTFG